LRTRQQHDGHAAQQIWKASRGNAVLTKSGTIGKNDKLWKNYWTQNKFMLSFHKGLKIIIPTALTRRKNKIWHKKQIRLL
jgi:hypothetical protein